MATTLMDTYMKMTATCFVHTAVQSTINKIMESKVSCEVSKPLKNCVIKPNFTQYTNVLEENINCKCEALQVFKMNSFIIV